MLGPVQNLLSSLLDQGMAIVPVILGLCIAVYGIVMAMGDHAKGRQGVIWALVGGSLALGAKTIAAAIHP